MTDFDPNLNPQRLEGQLSEREQAIRDVFVAEYMRDFDPYKACIRMGFLATFAVDQSRIFMEDGYVLRKIAYLTSKSVEPNDDDRAAMLANLRWLAHNGSAASRTAATQRYMEAQGYVRRGDDGEEVRTAQLIDALANFANNAPS